MENALKDWLYDPAVGRVTPSSETIRLVETPVLDVSHHGGREKAAP